MTARPIAPWPPLARAVVAGLLSAVLPGAGSFYLGRLWTANAALILATLGSLLAALAWRLELISAVVLVWVVALVTALAHGGGALLAMVEAWRRPTKRGFLASLGFMVIVALAMVGMQNLSRHAVMATYAVATIAMEPSLVHGDRVLVRPGDGERVYRRGTIVALHDAEADENFVRRLIGLPGDHVVIRDAAVAVNGQALGRGPCEQGPQGCLVEQSADGLRYRVIDRMGDGEMNLQVTVPEGRVFVMRDRRDLSIPIDPVPRDWLKGTVEEVWWSYTHAGIDWTRLGRRVAPTEGR